MAQPVVVFDLDHTLITPEIRRIRGLKSSWIPDSIIPESVTPDLRITNSILDWLPEAPVADIDVYVRPWAREMLTTAQQRYGRVGIWTFGAYAYARTVLELTLGIDESDLEFFYTKDRPPPGYLGGVDASAGKPLDVIVANHGGPAIIVEDTPGNCIENMDFCLIVPRENCLFCRGPCEQPCATTKYMVGRMVALGDSVRIL